MKVYEHLKESTVVLLITYVCLKMQLTRLKIHTWRQRQYMKRLDKQNERLLNSSAALRDYWEFQQERKNKKDIESGGK